MDSSDDEMYSSDDDLVEKPGFEEYKSGKFRERFKETTLIYYTSDAHFYDLKGLTGILIPGRYWSHPR